MSKNPTWNYPVDAETLLIVAWLSTLNLETLLQVQQQACPYKRPDDLLKQIIREQLDEALACFQSDPVYGPALQHVVEYRIALVDLQCVQWAISLEKLIEPSNGVFLSDRPYYSNDPGQQKGKPVNETEAFWEGVAQHSRAASCLSHLSGSWQSNVCQGARSLRSFFPAYSRMMLRHRETPFFIGELLSISLQHVDWHTIAARILCIDSPSCQCSSAPSQEYEPAVNAQLFQELLTLVGEEIWLSSRRLPDDLRRGALFLSGLCKDYEAQESRQVQCPQCQQLVFPRCWVRFLDRCADCVRRDFGLEIRADGKFQKTPERATQDEEIGARREAK